jgi:hypothetical protein
MNSLSMNSSAGNLLMKNARWLQGGEGEEKEDNSDGNHQYDQYDVSWMKDFSIKFLGCHHVASWNSNAQEDNDVRIQKQRFVRFRLCQTDSCSSKNSLGCSSGYGDYVVCLCIRDILNSFYVLSIYTYLLLSRIKLQVDMDTFVSAYVENQRSALDESGGNNNYYAQRNVEFLGQYSQCSKYGNGDKRQLKENEAEYFIGPYCSNQGQDIHIGLFTDDTCTEFADSNAGISTYKGMTGNVLPYSKADSKSVVDGSCYACAQESDSYYDGQQQSFIKESCQNVYFPAGKCENRLSKFMSTTDPNNYGCKYINGIRFSPALSSGVLHRNRYGWVVSLFLSIFIISFLLLTCYVVYLKLQLAKQKRTAKRNTRLTRFNESPIKKYFESRRSKSRSQSRDRGSIRNVGDEKKHNRRRGFGFFVRKKKKKSDNHASLLS